MFCSTIIPTVGRPTLARAVNSVLNQDFTRDSFEVIVVNDSGKPLPAADWQQSDRVRILHTHHLERCVARNTGVAIATGKYLNFLDDDDWLLPEALEKLWQLANSSNAPWLYGATQLVDRAEQPLIRLNHTLAGNCFTQVMAGEWIPLQASLIETEAFLAVGGFNPLIPGIEDMDLLRRLALQYDVIGTPKLIAAVEMGEQGSTTNTPLSQQYGRWAREKTLNEPGVFSRLKSSADSSYWWGRVVRVYFTSMLWNLQRKRLFAAISRAGYGLMAVVLAGRYLFSTNFWQAVAKQHTSQVFLAGFQEAGLSPR